MSETSPAGLPISTLDAPRLLFAMEVRIWFTRVHTIPNMPSGAARGAVLVDRGEFHGPRLHGQVVPDSGGDYALFRPDDTVAFDARYLLREDDGTLILLHNLGYLWGYQPDTMQRLRQTIFAGGPPVNPSDYYLRACPRFEVESGKHDWLTRHVFIGIGERKPDGNLIRYYVLG